MYLQVQPGQRTQACNTRWARTTFRLRGGFDQGHVKCDVRTIHRSWEVLFWDGAEDRWNPQVWNMRGHRRICLHVLNINKNTAGVRWAGCICSFEITYTHTHTARLAAWLILQLNKKLEINRRRCLKYHLQGFDVSTTTQGLYVGRAADWIFTAVYCNTRILTTNQQAMHQMNMWYILQHLKGSRAS